jgi:hypothetical protein
MKYLTKETLEEVAKVGAEVGYSRQVGTDMVDRLPSGGRFPVVMSMCHDRVQGRRGVPHMRALVAVSLEETWQVDMDLDVFNSLPEVNIE